MAYDQIAEVGFDGSPDLDADDDMPTPILSAASAKLTLLMLKVLEEDGTGGVLHIFIEDANIEDYWMDDLRANASTDAERACIEHAASLSEGERWGAWLILNGRS